MRIPVVWSMWSNTFLKVMFSTLSPRPSTLSTSIAPSRMIRLSSSFLIHRRLLRISGSMLELSRSATGVTRLGIKMIRLSIDPAHNSDYLTLPQPQACTSSIRYRWYKSPDECAR